MVNLIFIILYVSVILMPNFRSLDIISSQGFYLNILNLISTCYLIINFFYRKKTLREFSSLSKFIFSSFSLFFFWGSITLIWALNKSEGYRTLTEIYTTILAFLNVYYHFRSYKYNTIKTIFVLLLCMQVVELYFLVKPFLLDISKGIFRGGSMTYNGLTGNKNIAAFSILIKTPLVLFYVFNQKTKILIRIITYIIFVFSTISVFFITQSRGAELSFILFVTFMAFAILFNKYYDDSQLLKRIKKLFLFSVLISLPFLLGKTIYTEKVNISENLGSLANETNVSSNERLKFYKYAIEIISENFFTGTGIGSWELESIEKDRLEMKSYVVPYHVHNDFLEIFTETGILGVIFFYFPFFLLYFRILKRIVLSNEEKNKEILNVIFLMLSMYLADALINFPFARVIQNINLIFIIVCGITILEASQNSRILDLTNQFFKKAIKVLLPTFILILPLSLYSSYRLFNSGRDQSLLLYAFNQNNFKILKEHELDAIDTTYPNLTGTALPISTIVGIHFYYLNKLEKSEKYLRDGIKANPYLNISKSYLGKLFEKKGELDSARYYTKLAFDKMPNNPVHFAHYIQVLLRENDTLAIKSAYNNVMYKDKDDRFDKLYLLAMSNLLDKDEGKFILNDIKKSQLKDDGLKTSYYILELGEDRVKLGFANYLRAETYFKNNDFTSAAKFYDKASENNPLEYPYIENASISYLKSGNLNLAMERINSVIDNFDLNSKKGKTFYVKGLIYLEMDQTKLACDFFEKALMEGFNTKRVLASYCK